MGGRDEVAAAVPAALATRVPGLRVAGAESPPFRSLRRVARGRPERRRRARAGSPARRRCGSGWARRSRTSWATGWRRWTPRPLVFCVGGAFEVVGGARPATPEFLRRAGIRVAAPAGQRAAPAVAAVPGGQPEVRRGPRRRHRARRAVAGAPRPPTGRRTPPDDGRLHRDGAREPAGGAPSASRSSTASTARASRAARTAWSSPRWRRSGRPATTCGCSRPAPTTSSATASTR